ncbi:pleckstrin homology domain-containing family A member 8 isoform X2 [Malaclemys terrapin pileata]|nr:pleckstrin homology domain-containing family A member 8 isoform X2 [Malaclemys terrapin pileata]XP_053876023.1 pleckstrin homology domain-containing family A member 8 isoform X2 [Malaclemys terrapin pileata]
MAVCEIQVHHADSTRMDLIIPGEQYFYLKARSAAERQKWLIALGTAKACLTDSKTQREKELTENTEALKTKMSELRLYCDLLVQQVDKTKEASICGVSESENGIDMGALLKSTCNTFLKTLEECMQIANMAFSSELLHHTPSGSPHLAVLKSNKVTPPVSSSSTTTERQMELNSCENGSVKAETNHCEQTLFNTLIPSHLKSNEGDCDVSTENHVEKKLTGDEVKDDGGSKMLPIEGNNANESLQLAMDSISGPAPSHWGEGNEEDLPTFFSVMNNRFNDIELQEGDGIPTEEFLQSCYAIVPVLDKLGPTVFAPVKMDFVGNIKCSEHELPSLKVEVFIFPGGMDRTLFMARHSTPDLKCQGAVEQSKALPPQIWSLLLHVCCKELIWEPAFLLCVRGLKINQKYITNREEFNTLQKIVLHEVSAEVARVRNSATEALLWLKRGLKFLKGFLTEVKNGEKNIQTALNNAYGKTLRQHHGWVVRGVFALALRAAPTYEDFVAALSVKKCDDQEEAFYNAMQRDLNIYLPAMENQLNILDTLYEVHGLESDEVV